MASLRAVTRRAIGGPSSGLGRQVYQSSPLSSVVAGSDRARPPWPPVSVPLSAEFEAGGVVYPVDLALSFSSASTRLALLTGFNFPSNE